MQSPSSSRLPGLDTLRAVAILAVMLFHTNYLQPLLLQPLGEFGWMGVDLFFVLSGYLIGSQLLKPFTRGQRPSLTAFYRRRAFRILPAYWVVLALYYAWPQWREAPEIAPAWQFLTFTLNLVIDYGRYHAFSHAWSLCVEEHFYLILPILALWMMRPNAVKTRAFQTTAILLALVAAGIALRAFILVHILRPIGLDGERFGPTYIETLYYPTWVRLDPLLAGVTLALLKLFRPAQWNRIAAHGHALLLSGLALVGLACYLMHDRFEGLTGVGALGNIIGYPVLALGLAALVASALSLNGWLARIRIPGAQLIATLAFSLYLTHKEIVRLTRHVLPALTAINTWRALPIYAVACAAAAAILYFAVERPFMQLRDHLDHRRAPIDEELRREPAL